MSRGAANLSEYRNEWWRHTDGYAADLELPGIYEWRLGDESLYIG
jgi:hypothetical protein